MRVIDAPRPLSELTCPPCPRAPSLLLRGVTVKGTVHSRISRRSRLSHIGWRARGVRQRAR